MGRVGGAAGLMAGKGDVRRPTAVDHKTFDDNWSRVFGKRKPNIATPDTDKDSDASPDLPLDRPRDP